MSPKILIINIILGMICNPTVSTGTVAEAGQAIPAPITDLPRIRDSAGHEIPVEYDATRGRYFIRVDSLTIYMTPEALNRVKALGSLRGRAAGLFGRPNELDLTAEGFEAVYEHVIHERDNTIVIQDDNIKRSVTIVPRIGLRGTYYEIGARTIQLQAPGFDIGQSDDGTPKYTLHIILWI